MLHEIDFPKSGIYRYGSTNEPLNFFADVLPESTHFDILLGYFSSSAIRVLSIGFAKFIMQGGKARFVINNILSEHDKEAILKGENTSEPVFDFSINNYTALKESLDTEGVHFFNCLAWLISTKRVEIVSVKPKNEKGWQGMQHTKIGIFSEGTNNVLFNGSCNFTAMALLGNSETINTQCSWDGSRKDLIAINEQKEEFEKIFNKKASNLEYLNIKDLEIAIKSDFGNKEVDELLLDELSLLAQKKEKLSTNPKFKRRIEQLEKEIQILRGAPRFPFGGGARQYQIDAYTNWLANDCKGIFAMATGTGKTITALNCVLEEYKKLGLYHVVIVVPTNVLVTQWEKEAKKFNMKDIVKVSSKFTGWQRELDRIITSFEYGLEQSFVTIVTYASFSKAKFQNYFHQLPQTTILIADEAHNMASPSIVKILSNVKLEKRIGLSATPKRIYDPEGSKVMEAFFRSEEPYTYSFSMERAIREEILCQYYYYPKLVSLNAQEMEKYSEITNQLVKYFSKAKQDNNVKKRLEELLMQRKRIIHKAIGKIAAFTDILNEIEERKGRIEYTLVYAPEGKFEDEFWDDSKMIDTDEELSIIDYYSSIIREKLPNTTVAQYKSESEDKDSVLKNFEKGDINMLLSMKCLDEGVDIPRTEQAIFCSSTGNPRQFIQRRGRILRQHRPEKQFAYIYDLVVIPELNVKDEAFNIEQNLVKKELERVVNFAYMAINKYEAIKVFEDICAYYDLNLDTINIELNS